MAGGTSTPQRQTDPILEFLGKNATITAALFILMLALLKLAAVTYYDPTTMLSLANTVGAGSVLTGTFFSPPWAGLLVLEALSLRWFLLARHREWPRVVPAGAAAFFAVLLTLLLPPGVAIIFGVVLLGLLVEWVLRSVIERTHGLSDPVHLRVVNALTAIALAAVFLWSAFFNTAMWLPKEIMFAQKTVTDPGMVIEGYVLGTEGKWLNVLVSGKRKIRRLHAEWVQERTICLHHETKQLWWTAMWTDMPWVEEPVGQPPPPCKEVREQVERAHPGASTTTRVN